MLRFKEKDRQKEQKSGFHCSMDEVSVELSSTEDNPRGNNCTERFSSLAPSTTNFTPETIHAVIVSFTKKFIA